MKYSSLVFISILAMTLSSCSSWKKRPEGRNYKQQTSQAQTVSVDTEAAKQSTEITKGWPEASTRAATDLISKYGSPTEVTSDMLVWRNIAPFKRIVVHKEVYENRFPLLHQEPVEHVINYRARGDKVDDLWKFNGAIVVDRVKGEMAASGFNEAMNILSLNLAHDIMMGKISAETARIEFGQESMDYLNGKRPNNTQALSFGNQLNTADAGQSITNKIRWIGGGNTPYRKVQLRQAQEANQNR
ncbi:MAG: hypothetical protein AB7I27_19570 [Bacteriovoracaceae bacterium]